MSFFSNVSLNAYGIWATALSGRYRDVQRTSRMHVLMSTSLLICINIIAKVLSFKKKLYNTPSTVHSNVISFHISQNSLRCCRDVRSCQWGLSSRSSGRYPWAQDHLRGIFLKKTTKSLLVHGETYKAVFASFHLLWCFIQVESTLFSFKATDNGLLFKVLVVCSFYSTVSIWKTRVILTNTSEELPVVAISDKEIL